MATATAARRQRQSDLEDTEVEASEPQLGEDGYPFRVWPVGGDTGPRQQFSLRPYEPDEAPVYWNFINGDGHMWWRDYRAGPDGIKRVIVKHRWIRPYPGSFQPRNDWENHMVREWMVTTFRQEGWTIDPDDYKGFDHPENEPGKAPHMWVCECSWGSGKMKAMKSHQTYHGSGHKHMISL